MKLFASASLGFFLIATAPFDAMSQAPAAPMGPPKVLLIQREYLKPGKAGSAHEKTESAFVKAMEAAKSPTYYLAMDALTGPDRMLFFTPFGSFAEWEKDHEMTEKNAALSAALDRASIADGDVLASADSSVWTYREDLSQTPPPLNASHYMDITQFKVKSGHMKEFEELAKLYKEAFASAPDAHWAVFKNAYGTNGGGVVLVMSPYKSLAEIDTGFGESGKAMASLGEGGQKKLASLTASCIEETQANLFHFNPKLSYLSDTFKSSDAAFWKPAPAVTKKPTAAAKAQ